MSHAARQTAIARTFGPVVVFAALAAGPATRPDAPVDRGDPPAAAGEKADAKKAAKPAAARVEMQPVGVVREVEGDERNEAFAARDRADLLRAAFEQAHRGPGAAKAGGGADAAFNDVVAAYRDAIGRFPGTEIDCYCRLRLAGAYQYRGLFDATLNECKQAAERFAGTKPGMEAAQAVGLTYLQALHDPAQAAVWFRQLQTAAGLLKDDAERIKWQAAAAQGLARCEELRPPPPAAKK